MNVLRPSLHSCVSASVGRDCLDFFWTSEPLITTFFWLLQAPQWADCFVLFLMITCGTVFCLRAFFSVMSSSDPMSSLNISSESADVSVPAGTVAVSQARSDSRSSSSSRRNRDSKRRTPSQAKKSVSSIASHCQRVPIMPLVLVVALCKAAAAITSTVLCAKFC